MSDTHNNPTDADCQTECRSETIEEIAARCSASVACFRPNAKPRPKIAATDPFITKNVQDQ